MALNFPSPAYDGEIYVDPTSGSKYIYVAASTKWMSIQHVPVVISYGFDKANSAYLTANAAYDVSNAAYTFSNSAYASINSNWTVQNALYAVANASFAVANAALPNVSNAVFDGNLRVTGNLQIGSNTITITNNHIIANDYFRVNTGGHRVAVTDGNIVNAVFDLVNVSFNTANASYASANNVGPQIAPTYNTANAAFGVANAAYGAANNVGPQIAPAFNTANAAFGVANTALQNTSGVTFNGNFYLSNGSLGVGNTTPGPAKVHITSANTVGGVGYADFLRVTNASYPAVTNPVKTFRLNQTGIIEVINNAYTAVIMQLDDTGLLQASASMRAPIFYDSDNTAYYVDPASTSNINNLTVNGTLSDSSSGMVGFFARNSAPTGWLKANGAAVSRSAYASLFAAIGTTFGSGDGSSTFNLPDMRGYFPRSWDDSRGVDSGRSFASAQDDAFQGHWHSYTGTTTDNAGGIGGIIDGPNTRIEGGGNLILGPISDGSNGTPRTAAETRPKNIALLACIKF